MIICANKDTYVIISLYWNKETIQYLNKYEWELHNYEEYSFIGGDL